MKTTAIFVTEKNTVNVESLTIPAISSNELLIRTAYSCISPGTELRCLDGREVGATDYPFIPGYALSGEVMEAGQDVAIPVGTHVFCSGMRGVPGVNSLWGGHTGYAKATENEVVIIPEGVEMLTASLTALGAIAYHGCSLAKPQKGEQVVVIGLGPLGQLSSRIFSAMGLKVCACDLSPARVEIAKKAGIDAVLVNKSLKNTLSDLIPEGADIVVDVTGVPAVIPQAMELTRELPWNDEVIFGSRYLLQGSYAESFTVPYKIAFANEVTFLVPRDCRKKDKENFLSMLAKCQLNTTDLISETFSPENAQAAYDYLRNSQNMLTVAFNWQ